MLGIGRLWIFNMPLNRSQLAEHLMERIYDVLEHNQVICLIDINDFKNIIRQDVLIQLSIIEEELTRKE